MYWKKPPILSSLSFLLHLCDRVWTYSYLCIPPTSCKLCFKICFFRFLSLSLAYYLTLYLPIFLFEYESVHICVSCLLHVWCVVKHAHTHILTFSLPLFLVVFERSVHICVSLLTHICYVKKHSFVLSLAHSLAHSLPLFARMYRMMRCTSFHLFTTYYFSKHHNIMQVLRWLLADCLLYIVTTVYATCVTFIHV